LSELEKEKDRVPISKKTEGQKLLKPGEGMKANAQSPQKKQDDLKE
jgi:hypothetical protein